MGHGQTFPLIVCQEVHCTLPVIMNVEHMVVVVSRHGGMKHRTVLSPHELIRRMIRYGMIAARDVATIAQELPSS